VKEVSILKQRFPFAGLLMAAIAGILLSSWLGSSWLLFIGLSAVSLPLLLFWRKGGLCWVLTLTIFALMQLWSWQESPASKLAAWLEAHPQEFQILGVISGEPKASTSGVATFPLRLEELRPIDSVESMESIGSMGEEGKAITLPVLVQVRWSGVTPQYGDRVSFRAMPARPAFPRNPGTMDYRGWLERHGIYTQFRLDPSQPGSIVSSGHGNPLIGLAIKARHRMEAILAVDLGGAPEVLSAIKGITLGVTEDSPEGFTDDFRFTGTMHLFSVSGLHVGMLAVIIWFVLKAARLPRAWAVALTIPSLFFYVAVTGLKAGSIRSATMASVLLIGLALFRRSPMLNTLAASAFLQLAFDTNVLFSAGWQFSYTVVFAILIAARPIERWVSSWHAPDPFIPPKLLTRREHLGFDAWEHFSGLAAVSAAAWIGSLIPTIVYFHLISLSAFGANLLAVPLAFVVLSLGALSLLSGSFSLWIAGAFNNANWLVTKLLLLVVQMSALLPGGHWFIGPPGKPFPVMTILDMRGASCAVIRHGSEFALVDTGRKRDASGTVLPYLESSGANSIQGILITKSDAAHLGGLEPMKRALEIQKTGTPPGEGRSPMAKAVLHSMHPLTRLHAGESWPLVSGVAGEILDPQADVIADSLIVRIQLGGIRVLMLPRLDPYTLARLAMIPDNSLKAEVIILPLGGSELSASLQVIRRIAPWLVISTVDGLNRNGLPSSEWKNLLADEGVILMRQDETGAVLLEADPQSPKAIPFLQPDYPVSLDGQTPVTGANPKKPLIE
jgi:ComEC/Rec2-related protein